MNILLNNDDYTIKKSVTNHYSTQEPFFSINVDNNGENDEDHENDEDNHENHEDDLKIFLIMSMIY